MPLDRYRAKRDFAATPEPAPAESAAPPDGSAPRFVVQEHNATRLHWDLRLEHDGVAVSWAIPNGIPATPKDNRLAVHTEDHPLEYLEFEGDIPKGEYGAGTMRVWDRGTFETIKFDERKVEVVFHGERLQGRYGLFPIGRGDNANDWMIHRMDPPDDPSRVEMPEHLVPMMARSGTTIPPDAERWSFEVKWDGVRAIAYAKPGRLRLESRNLREITDSYPEVRAMLRDLGMHEVVLDGEIVAFGQDGRPDFGALQRRMHVTTPSSVRRLMSSLPVVYAIFDLLYLDGRSLFETPYAERRELLEGLGLGGAAWRVPAAHSGDGARLLEATATQGLEGIVAKRLDSSYHPGARNGAWVKVKHTQRQEMVIGGWIPGDGRRQESIGALLMGVSEDGALRYTGRVGTGFTERTLADLSSRLAKLRRDDPAFAANSVKFPRGAVFVEPELVAEVEFREWTHDGVMRAPSYKGLREDKDAREVVLEGEAEPADPTGPQPSGGPVALHEGLIEVDGRELKISNWDKVLYPATGFTKGDLITYYARVADAVLPHLRDRPLTLKRYPNGVDAKYFFEKNAPSHRPDWVRTATVGGIEYVLAEERATMVWLGNLADIELHTPMSLASAPERPTMMVFDLDPGPPAGILECCEVALVLHGMFEALGLEMCVKTSGSKGLQVYVPLNTEVGEEPTKQFAKAVAELLEQRLPKLVVSRMTKTLRKGKVLLDWSQNHLAKTTVTVYSVRAREQPTVSTPLLWDEVGACREAGDPELLSFLPDQVLARVAEHGDLFAPVLSVQQKLPTLT
jgi:bifunctional non-homologous end joining protein LigD